MTVLPSKKLRDHAQAAMFEWDRSTNRVKKFSTPLGGVTGHPSPVVVVEQTSSPLKQEIGGPGVQPTSNLQPLTLSRHDAT